MHQNNMTKEMKTTDEVLILYVKDFKPKNNELELDGHLHKGGIYLCLKHEEEKEPKRIMYRIFFDDGKKSMLDGIFLHDLHENNESWACELEELDFTKIDEYRLSDSEIDYAIDIKNMSLEEVKAKMDKGTKKDDIDKSVFERLDETLPEPPDELDIDAIERIYNELDNGNTESKNNLKDVLDDVIEYVGTTFDDKYENSMIKPMDMLMGENGKILNVFNATKYLSRYSTEGYEKSDNPKDLMKAIHYILIEMNRVKTNLK
jgi:hypothetical protein